MIKRTQGFLSRAVGRLGIGSGFRVELVDVPPDRVQRNRVYMIGDDRLPRAALIRCPCCGEEVHALSLERSDPEHWSIRTTARGTASLTPVVLCSRHARRGFTLDLGRVVQRPLVLDF